MIICVKKIANFRSILSFIDKLLNCCGIEGISGTFFAFAFLVSLAWLLQLGW